MKKLYYTFSQEEMDKFGHCPRCGSDYITISSGDIAGVIQCHDCPKPDNTIDFTISHLDVDEDD